MNSIQQAKAAADVVAVPTALYVAIGEVMGYVQSGVAILAGLLAAAYTAYRIYDLYDQRRKRK